MSENISRYNKKAKPVQNNPLADIVVQFVIPYKENYQGMVHLLEKLLQIKNLNFEIMVVDDNSSNETFFTNIIKLPGVAGHRFTEDKGFGYCVNFATNQTARNIVIVLHSDVYDFEVNTFKNLVLELINGKEQKVALISAVIDNPMPSDCHVVKATASSSNSYYLIQESKFVPFVCVAFSKSAFQKCGGLPNYPYCWFEDKLFCKKLFAFGYKIAVAPSSFVRHKGGQSIQRVLSKNPRAIELIKGNIQSFSRDSQILDDFLKRSV